MLHMPAPGDIASALSESGAYRLHGPHAGSHGRIVRVLTNAAATGGSCVSFGRHWTARASTFRSSVAIACMMILFFQAARLALVVFDPYLSSRPLASALLAAPDGKLILNGQYYTFFFRRFLYRPQCAHAQWQVSESGIRSLRAARAIGVH